MRIALIDGARTISRYLGRKTYYPIGLLRLGAMLRDKGHHCDLFSGRLPVAGEYDEAWLSTLFTFDINTTAAMASELRNRCQKVIVGGIAATLMPGIFERTGADVVRGLVGGCESYSPDYSLLSSPIEYCIVNTSRGCIRKCGFCAVNTVEPAFADRPNWEQDIVHRKVLFYDNNWLAKPRGLWTRDTEIIRGFVDSRRVTSIDFNQGIDARLVDSETSRLMSGLPLRPVRFSFDGMHEDGHVQRAVRLMSENGHRSFVVYCLYNWKDTPRDLYYRMRACVQMSVDLGVSCLSFPMRYRPIMSADVGSKYIGKHWSTASKSGFGSILQAQAITGLVSAKNFEEFEHWWGRNDEEFVRLINYGKIHQLNRQKRASRRFGLSRTNA